MVSNKTSIKLISICTTLLLSTTALVNFQLHAQEQVSSVEVSKEASQTSTAIFVDDNKASYGPILKTDTLWKIAVAHRPDETVTNFQVMMALFASNPNAFLRNDINTLVEGQYLRIPSLEEIRTVAPYSYGKNEKTAIEVAANDIAVGKVVTTTVTTDNKVVNDNLANPVPQSSVAPKQMQASVSTESIPSKPDSSDAANNIAEEQPGVAFNDDTNTTLQAEVNISQENKELKESLTAVDDQLSYLQYEVAKASEKQSEMDSLIAEQKRLLAESKKREQRLIAQQQALAKQREGIFNNPILYWSTTGVLAFLVIVLFVLVYRRRNTEQQQKLSNITPNEQSIETSKTSEPATQNTEVTAEHSAANSHNSSSPTVATDAGIRLASEEDEDEGENDLFTAEDPFTHKEEAFDSKIQPENQHVETAFAKIDLSNSSQCDDELLTDEDLLNSLVSTPLKQQPNINDLEFNDEDDLDIDQIINGMLDEETKPAKLRSSLTGHPKQHSTNQSDSDQDKPAINEINDYDDVEFDKLLEEISAQTNDVIITPPSNVVQMQPATEKKPEPQAAEQDYIAIEQLIEDSQETEHIAEEEIYNGEKIDVGLDEFPEFTNDVKHVDVDDDKNGVNAKLDLAQVYIEIGDFDNAAVILKSVMKLGTSAQQQQAQTLLYSLHD